MTIDWNAFSPWTALAGGLLIGLASAGLWLLLGRIAGISGIVANSLQQPTLKHLWRVAFVAGLVFAGWVWQAFRPLPTVTDASVLYIAVAGLLVGIGVRLGSGCTSGHGVCGLARLSPRSLLATLLFMALAMLTVYITRHLLGSN